MPSLSTAERCASVLWLAAFWLGGASPELARAEGPQAGAPAAEKPTERARATLSMPALAWLQQCLNEDTFNASLAAAVERDRSFQLQASGLRVELSVSEGGDGSDAGPGSSGPNTQSAISERPSEPSGRRRSTRLQDPQDVHRSTGAGRGAAAARVRPDSRSSTRNLRAARSDHVLSFMIRVWRGRAFLGSRVFSVQENECAALPDAVALVVLLLASSASPATEDAEPSGPAALPTTSITRDSETPPRPNTPLEAGASEEAHLVGIGAGASAVVGLLPSTALAVHVVAETAPTWFGIQLRGTLLWPQTRTVAEGSVRFEGYRIGLHGCLAWDPRPASRLDFRACAGPAATWLRASGRGFTVRNDSTTKLAIHADLQLQAAWAFAPATWLRVHGGAGVALQRPRFLLALGDSTEALELPSPSVLAGELGLSVVQIF